MQRVFPMDARRALSFPRSLLPRAYHGRAREWKTSPAEPVAVCEAAARELKSTTYRHVEGTRCRGHTSGRSAHGSRQCERGIPSGDGAGFVRSRASRTNGWIRRERWEAPRRGARARAVGPTRGDAGDSRGAQVPAAPRAPARVAARHGAPCGSQTLRQPRASKEATCSCRSR